MTSRSHWRGHPIHWDGESWRFTDNNEVLPDRGGKIRPCKHCGKTFEGSYAGEADPCLGELPGVDNACCGHGVRDKAYIRFTNGTVVKGFIVEQQ